MSNIDSPDSSDDSFGLPEIELVPLAEQDAQSQPYNQVPFQDGQQQESYDQQPYQYDQQPDAAYSDDIPPNNQNFENEMDEKEPSKKRTVMVLSVIAVILLLGGGGYLLYNYVWIPRQEKAKQELLARQAEELRKQQEEAERKRLEEEQRLKSEEAKPVGVGTIETLEGRTGRYYVIVTSNIDVDLMTDYAKKLSKNGISTKIIKPGSHKRFYMLAVSDFEELEKARIALNELKSEYSDKALWVVKY